MQSEKAQTNDFARLTVTSTHSWTVKNKSLIGEIWLEYAIEYSTHNEKRVCILCGAKLDFEFILTSEFSHDHFRAYISAFFNSQIISV